MTQRFNADTAALERREILNRTAARFDLEQWILGYVRPTAGQSVLDLGCGRGKQIFALAHSLLPGGSVLGIDLSSEAVAEVRRRAADERYEHVSAEQGDLSDCLVRLAGRQFDRILSAYAIYYARDMLGLLKGLRAHLAPRGQAFHCGFGRGTNQEIIDLVNHAAGAPILEPIDDFISREQIKTLRDEYSEVRVARLGNRIDFRGADEVMDWWRHHNSYQPELDGPVRRSVADFIAERGSFPLSKNVIGIHLYG